MPINWRGAGCAVLAALSFACAAEDFTTSDGVRLRYILIEHLQAPRDRQREMATFVGAMFKTVRHFS